MIDVDNKVKILKYWRQVSGISKDEVFCFWFSLLVPFPFLFLCTHL